MVGIDNKHKFSVINNNNGLLIRNVVLAVFMFVTQICIQFQ